LSCNLALTRKIIKLLTAPLAIIINALARFIPKDDKTWLFSSWNGRKYSDNSRFIYEYALQNDDSLNVYWMCKTLQLKKEMEKMGLPACYSLSLKGLYLHLTASRVVLSHSVHWEYYPVFLSSNTKRIQTWHGTPIKKIGYDNVLSEKRFYRDWISRIIFYYNIDHFDLVLSNSEFFRKIYASAFRTDIARILVTGSPRDDGLVKGAGDSSGKIMNQGNQASQLEAKKLEPLTILYAPTLRGAAYSKFQGFKLGGWDFTVVDECLGKLNANLYVKLHPAQVMIQNDVLAIDRCDNIRYIPAGDDLINHDMEIGILITDYSGIYFDFLLTGKPIFFYIPDEQEYLKYDRDVYMSSDELSPMLPARDLNTLLNQLSGYVESDSFDFGRLQKLKSQFHSFSDGKNSERAFYAIRDLS